MRPIDPADPRRTELLVPERASFEELRRTLAEAEAWCGPRFDPARPSSSLRTARLAPRVLSGSYAEAVTTVVQARRHALGSAHLSLSRPISGRLLLYFPDADLCDGAAE